MAIIQYDLNRVEPLTKEEEEELRQAANAPFVYDEDCPPLTDEQIKEIQAMLKAKREAEQKQMVSLRLANKYIEKAKQLGKGYTSILGDIIEYVLDNPELLKQCISGNK